MSVVRLIFIFIVIEISLAQIIIPKKYDGFPLYYSNNKGEGSIMVEAFFDPLCPDSRDSWPPLKQALQYYSPHLSFIFHPFPLPYHSNAYIASHALHIANKLNSSTTFPLLELFFKFQEKYYNDPTFNMSRAKVTDDITNLAISLIGKSYSQAFKAGFQDPQTNEAQKISFKYGCSRGVASTPTFLVNGFALPGAGAALQFQQWKSIIDPLLKNN
ncbi:putative thioredoxin-like protein [Dioscorea sansibarensis]